ncbi:MAG: hypothetical protein BGN93_01895, partial [Acinetobacter sp. 39-4]
LQGNKSIPWSLKLIEKYEKNWDWEKLSENEHLPWTLELIEKYEDKWNFRYLSINNNLPWSIDLIEKYQDKWSWGALTECNLPWSIELLDKFKERWNWMSDIYWDIDTYYYFPLIKNKNIPWSIELIEIAQDYIDWDLISSSPVIHWSAELIERFKEKWNWKNLTFNGAVYWSDQLIEQFKDYCDWGILSENIYWSEELIEKFKNDLDWSALSYGKMREQIFDNSKEETGLLARVNQYENFWSIEHIDKYLSYIAWDKLSADNSFFYTEELERYKHLLNWKIISQSIDVSIYNHDLVEKFKDNLDWHILSITTFGDWNLNGEWMVERFKNLWDWKVLSNFNLKHSFLTDHFIDLCFAEEVLDEPKASISLKSPLINFIEKYQNYWDWSILSKNKFMPWSIEILEKFKDQWIWESAKDIPVVSKVPTCSSAQNYPNSNQVSTKVSSFDLERESIQQLQDAVDWEKISNEVYALKSNCRTTVQNHFGLDSIQRTILLTELSSQSIDEIMQHHCG